MEPQLDNNQLMLPFFENHEENFSRFFPKSNPSRIFPVIPTKVYDTFWYFAAERQKIFFKKFYGEFFNITSDPILKYYKFTNTYRASDRVSQYLINNVIYQGDQSIDELFFRIMIFKVFNRISTWELLRNEFSEVALSNYSFHKFDKILTQKISTGTPIFSAAYIMPSGNKGSSCNYKHQAYLKLIENMIKDNVPKKLSLAQSMQSAFQLLRSYPMLGDFLAYQYVIDINYSNITDFSESEFVMPGPGARDGIRKCFSNFGGLNEIDIIKLIADIQEEEFSRLGIDFKSLWGRRLQLIDCQNLFCEVDKYARVAHPDVSGIHDRKRIKQSYQPQITPIRYWYPPKWGINELIRNEELKKEE